MADGTGPPAPDYKNPELAFCCSCLEVHVLPKSLINYSYHYYVNQLTVMCTTRGELD